MVPPQGAGRSTVPCEPKAICGLAPGERLGEWAGTATVRYFSAATSRSTDCRRPDAPVPIGSPISSTRHT